MFVPLVLMWPIVTAIASVNQRLPSGPLAKPNRAWALGIGYSVVTPAVGIKPTFWPPHSTNQRLLSGPTTIAYGQLALPGGIGKSVPAKTGRASPASKIITTANRIK